MTRGNQREKAREKNLKDQAGQKKKNTQSGTEFQRTKEAQAAIMREKQAKGGIATPLQSAYMGLSTDTRDSGSQEVRFGASQCKE
ncbi:uncharacterized protein PV07_00841 [Cladophialophora immunda]|uniref:Small EDRK-rich factor-like N-terminal domain-containing protein n=1 Tax=Cladophialophora immunda TaxID=569365 RepID=A0A0D2DEE9_9EURO|nr:uncharacterized protein PV07_00841 [Cladophialophora immunda]KIW34039.1 hypothetical protein PV07_00841 [Cladophialophora immunda]